MNSYLYLKQLLYLEKNIEKGELDLADAVETYFSIVTELLDKLQTSRAILTNSIVLEIDKYPSSNIKVDDLLKDLYPEYMKDV